MRLIFFIIYFTNCIRYRFYMPVDLIENHQVQPFPMPLERKAETLRFVTDGFLRTENRRRKGQAVADVFGQVFSAQFGAHQIVRHRNVAVLAVIVPEGLGDVELRSGGIARAGFHVHKRARISHVEMARRRFHDGCPHFIRLDDNLVCSRNGRDSVDSPVLCRGIGRRRRICLA